MSESGSIETMPIAPNRVDLLIMLGLVVSTMAIYGQVVTHHFINLDDPSYIVNNPAVNHGVTLPGMLWALIAFHAANWHPLTWISHMIDAQLFGLNAGGHLFVNALIHSANAALVFWFLRRATTKIWPSAIVAALFALHPLHVESVAWAAERKDTLSTLFGLLSLIAYVRYAESPSTRRYLLVALALILGLMAKSMLVTWPFVMLLLDYWPLGRWHSGTGKAQTARRLLVEKIPLFVIVGLSSLITYVAQSHGGATRAFVATAIDVRLCNALIAYTKYVWLTLWPHNLVLYYPYRNVVIWDALIAAFPLIVITGFCFSEREQRPYLIVGWLWFVGTLVPVIGLIQVGGQAMADRYHYVPSIGLFTALVFGVADFVPRGRTSCAVVSGVTAVVLVVFSILTFRQIQLWRDTFTLFEHTLRIAPRGNLPIEYNLGLAYADIGKDDEAMVHFENTLKINPHFPLALVSMGTIRHQQGRISEARALFERAAQAEPNLPQAHIGLGLCFAAQNETESAIAELREAARLDPTGAARANLGLILAQSGKITEGIDTLHEALRLDPNNAEAHNNLGAVLFAIGKTRESIPEFQAALRLNPSLNSASKNLDRAWLKLASEP